MLAIAMSNMLFTWSSAPLSAFRAAEGAGPHGLQHSSSPASSLGDGKASAPTSSFPDSLKAISAKHPILGTGNISQGMTGREEVQCSR